MRYHSSVNHRSNGEINEKTKRDYGCLWTFFQGKLLNQTPKPLYIEKSRFTLSNF